VSTGSQVPDSDASASERALTSLAFMNIKWDQRNDSYIDNFVPFVVHALTVCDGAVVATPQVRECVKGEFGIDLPTGVIETILGRVVRLGFASRDHGVYAPHMTALADFDISSDRARAQRLLSSLVDRFILFAQDVYQVDMTSQDAESLLLDYISGRALPLLRTVVRSAPYSPTLEDAASDWFLVGSFVSTIYERNPDAFDALSVIVQGSMLMAVVYSPDLGRVQQRFSDLTLYLDTPMVLRILGLVSDVQNNAAQELVELARNLGARVGYFTYTRSEVTNVLTTCCDQLRAARRTREPFERGRLDVVDYCLANAIGPSDLELRIEHMHRDLERLGVRIMDPPAYDIESTIDEADLENHLRTWINYRNPAAAVHDVQCISAVVRARGDLGRMGEIERSRSVFVTTNGALVRAVRVFFGSELGRRDTPYSYLDYEITTLCWLKAPLQAPELPQKQILADCYAAMQPGDELWTAYLAEVERLHEAGGVTQEDYDTLRFSIDARRALMDSTLGRSQAFSAGTVADVLEHARRVHQGMALDEARRARADASAAEGKRALAEERLVATRDRIATRARRQARLVVRSTQLVLGALGLIGLVYAGFGLWLTAPSGALRLVLLFGALVAFVLSVGSAFWGHSLGSLAQRAEDRLAGRLRDRLARDLIDDDGAVDMAGPTPDA
jgi:hypothetical protein